MATSEPKGATAPSEGRSDPDFSVIKSPVQLGSTGLKQLLQCYHVGSEEVRTTLLRECEVIVECKVCRSLYRGLPNFLAHKRHYCTRNYAGTLVRFQDMLSKEDEAVICGTAFGEDEFYRDTAQVSQNVEAVRNTETVIRLDSMEPTGVAVSQRYGNQDDLPVRKRKAEDDGHRPAKVPKTSQGSSALDGVVAKKVEDSLQSMRAFLIENRLVKPSTNVCVQCRVQFSGKGPLNKHMKRKHFKRKVFRQCVKCPKVFLSDSGYLSHAVGEHALSVAAVKEKLSSSVGLVEKIVYNNEVVYDVPRSFSFMKNQTIDHQSGQESICDLTVEVPKVTKSPEKVASSSLMYDKTFESDLSPVERKELAMMGVLALGIAQENWNQRFKCLIHPKFKFKKYVSFREHVVTQHCLPEIKCIKCPQKFTQRDNNLAEYFCDFVKHLDNTHGITGSNVTSDVKASLRESTLADIALAQDFQVIKCHLCSNTYGHRRTLKRHLIENHQLPASEADNIVHSIHVSELSHVDMDDNDENETSKEETDRDMMTEETSTLEYHILKTFQIWTDATNAFQKFKCFSHPSHLFRQFDKFKEHLLKLHCQSAFKCPLCKAIFGQQNDPCQNFTSFVDHLEDSHSMTPKLVEDIAEQLRKALMKNPNELDHLKKSSHKCPLCQSYYHCRKYLKHHLRTVHNIYSTNNESAHQDDEESRKDLVTGKGDSPIITKSVTKEQEDDTAANDEQNEKDFFLFMALGIWGHSDSVYQVYKCYTHPSFLFKRYTAVRDHIFKYHCKNEASCPKCQEIFPVNEIASHLINEHGINKSNVADIRTNLQKAMLKDPEEAEKYEGRSSVPSPQPIVCISKLENSRSVVPKSLSVGDSAKEVRATVSSRRASQSLISTFNLDDFHCPICIRSFTQMYAVVNHLTVVHGFEKEKALEMREQVKKASEKWRNQNLMIRTKACAVSDKDCNDDDDEDDGEMTTIPSPSRRKQLTPSKCQNAVGVMDSTPIVCAENIENIPKSASNSGMEDKQTLAHSTPKSSITDIPSIRKISFGAGFSLHKCSTCGKVFGKEAALASHQNTCTIDITADSDELESSASSSSASAKAVRRTRTCRRTEQKVCVKCGRKYMNLKTHLLLYCSEAATFKCPSCKKKFLKKGSLTNHIKFCSARKEAYSTDDDVASSVESEANFDDKSTGSFKCPECNLSIPTMRQVSIHLGKTHKWSKLKVAQHASSKGFGEVKQEEQFEDGNSTDATMKSVTDERSHGLKEIPQKSLDEKSPNMQDERKSIKSLSLDQLGEEKAIELQKERSNLQLAYLKCPLCPRTFVRYNSKVTDHWRMVHGLDEAGVERMRVRILEEQRQREELAIRSDRASRRASEGVAAIVSTGTNGNSSDSSSSRKPERKKPASVEGMPVSSPKNKQRLSLPSKLDL